MTPKALSRTREEIEKDYNDCKIPDPIYDQYYFSSPENQEAILRIVENLLKEERELQNKLKEIAINNLITDVNTARKEERNKVLEEVEKKLRDRIMHDTKDGYSTLYNEVTENLSDEVSTIINNLRVK